MTAVSEEPINMYSKLRLLFCGVYDYCILLFIYLRLLAAVNGHVISSIIVATVPSRRNPVKTL